LPCLSGAVVQFPCQYLSRGEYNPYDGAGGLQTDNQFHS